LRVEPSAASNGRIFIVDDDVSSAQALAALLREEGYETVVTCSSAEAETVLAAGACGLLLLDPSLRDHSGVHLLSFAEEHGVPMVVITSDPAFDPERTHSAAASAFLYKPIRFPRLLGLVEHALHPGRPA